jgi:hypothetical protein
MLCEERTEGKIERERKECGKKLSGKESSVGRKERRGIPSTQ